MTSIQKKRIMYEAKKRRDCRIMKDEILVLRHGDFYCTREGRQVRGEFQRPLMRSMLAVVLYDDRTFDVIKDRNGLTREQILDLLNSYGYINEMPLKQPKLKQVQSDRRLLLI